MEVHRLGIAGLDLQGPLAVAGLAELLDDRGSKRRQQLPGDVVLDVVYQILDELIRLLPADSLHFGIAVTRVAEVSAVERQIDVLGKASDRAERFG